MEPDGKSRPLAEVAKSEIGPEIKHFPSGEGRLVRQAQGLEKTAFSPIRKEIGVLRKKRKRRQKILFAVGQETDEVSSMADETAIPETPKRYPGEIFKEQRCKLCHSSSRVAKYYLGNGVIPCRSNGRSAHKYAVRSSKARPFVPPPSPPRIWGCSATSACWKR